MSGLFRKFFTLRVLSKVILTSGSTIFLYLSPLELYGAFIFLVQQAISIGRLSMGTTAEAFLQNHDYLKYTFKICVFLFFTFLIAFFTYIFFSSSLDYFSIPITIAIAIFTWTRIYGARIIICSSLVNGDGHAGFYELYISCSAFLVFVIVLYGQDWLLFLVCIVILIFVFRISNNYSKVVVQKEEFRKFLKNTAYLNYGGFAISGLRIFDRSIIVLFFGLEGFGLFVIGQLLASIFTYVFKISIDYLFAIKTNLKSLPKLLIVIPLVIFGIICFGVVLSVDFLGISQVNGVLSLLNKPLVEQDGLELVHIGLLLGFGMFGVQLISAILRLWEILIIVPIVITALLVLSYFLYGLELMEVELFVTKLKYQYICTYVLVTIIFCIKQYFKSIK